ncbi:MAG: hypothetical protein EOO69_12550 [Moraxellaceae bacterium]|nr:MAG: hypothetical protein EOO69_12550 [Moraxellaceae bacterium]
MNSDAKTHLSVVQKRQAVEEGLRPFLPNDYLQDILEFWELHYSHEPAFVLQRFLNEICTTAGLKAQRSQMLQSVLLALSARERENQPASKKTKPGKPVLRYADSLDSLDMNARFNGDQQAQALMQCFAALSQRLFRTAPAQIDRSLRLYLMDTIPKLKMGSDCIHALRLWTGTDMEAPPTSILNLEEIQQVINLIYSALCEYIGPVKADRQLSMAVKFLEENHPEWPIRQLL